MVTPLVVPQGVLVRLIWRKGTADWAVNVLGAQNTTPITINQTLANTISTAVQSGFTSSGLKALCSTTWALRQIGLRDINTPNNLEYIGTAAAQSGAVGTGTLPDNVSYCVTIRTLKAGRSYRGRCYIPGAGNTQQDVNGNPVPAYINACVAFVNAVGTALSANGLTPAVISRTLHVCTPWDSAVQRETIFSAQRRRLLPGI